MVLENLRTVYGPSLSDADQRRMAQCFYTHLSKLFFENLSLSWMSQDQIRNQLRIEGLEIVEKASQEGKGVIFLTGHFGNWELCPIAGMMHIPQFKGRFHILRRQIGNKWIEKLLFRRFYQAGLNVIPKRNSLDQVLEALAKNDVVTFIIDQHAKLKKDGIAVEFFGKKAGTFRSLALVAGKTGAPVVPTISYREKTGKHAMEFRQPLKWIEHPDFDTEIYLNTKHYNEQIERMILDHPDQWLWAHKRWKNK